MSNTPHTVTILGSLFPVFGKDFPVSLRSKTEELILQSTSKIPSLKSDEIARSYICAYLAFEVLENQIIEYMEGQFPDTSKIPLPARRIKTLLPLFRNKLFGYSDHTVNDTKTSRSPRKQTPNPFSPKKNASENIIAVSPSKASSVNLQSNFPVPPTKSEFELADDSNEISTTRSKRGPRSTGFKTSSRAKDPTRDQITTLCNSLQVKKPVSLAILRGYKLYNKLVKDKWGLLCGVIVVVISKGQPQLIERGTQAFYGRLKHLVAISDERLEEWIRWAASIITDQSWIKKVADPNSKTPVVQKEYKKYSSGIGNMVSDLFYKYL